MDLLLSSGSTQRDGVNLLPLIVVAVLLAAAALVVYLRRRGDSS